MEVVYYSRTTYIISDAFDIENGTVTFSTMLTLLSEKPLEELGFYEYMGYSNLFDTKVERMLDLTLKLISNGENNFELKPSTELKLGECIHSEYCLMGCGTSIYDAERRVSMWIWSSNPHGSQAIVADRYTHVLLIFVRFGLRKSVSNAYCL